MTLVITPFKNCFTMRRIYLRSGIFWCLVFLMSCTSKKSEFPVVQFISPNVNSVHDLTHDLIIEIDISDDSMIMEYRFWLESNNGWEYFAENRKVNADHYKILYKFDISQNIETDFTVHLEAEDDDGNMTHEKVDVVIH